MIGNIFLPQRLETETQVEYRERQKAVQVKLKALRRGTVFWDSSKKGTYRKGNV
jgi:hypothetical protein